MKFKAGDKVKFINKDGTIRMGGYYVGNYSCSNFPERYLIHGNTILHKSYDADGAEVVWTDGVWCAVKFISDRNKPVCLAFKTEQLKRMKIDDWRAEFR